MEGLKLNNKGSKFIDIYPLNMEEYKAEFIRNTSLNHETKVVCRRGRIFTVADLLDYSVTNFKKIYGFNQDVINDIDSFLKGFIRVEELDCESVYVLESNKDNIAEDDVMTDVKVHKEACTALEEVDSFESNHHPIQENKDDNLEFEVKSFGEIYELKAEDYNDLSVESAKFSVRVAKRLKIHGIDTIGELLELNPFTILSYKGLGNNSIKEIENFFYELKISGKESIQEIITVNKPQRYGDLEKKDFLERMNNILEASLIDEFKDADKRSITDFYLRTINEQLQVNKTISSAIKKISNERLECKAYGFILAYNLNNQIRELLLIYLDNRRMVLRDFLENIKNISKNNVSTVLDFINWLTFDIEDDVNNLFEKVFDKDRAAQVLKLRAEGKTLEEVGGELGVTRERVRQIEKKAAERFRIINGRYGILRKIYAVRNGDTVLTIDEIRTYLGDFTNVFSYLIKKFNFNDITYNEKLNVFIIADDSLDERAKEYVEQLPEVFSVSELNLIYERAEVEFNINSEMLEHAINEDYNLVGSTYSRKKLNKYDILVSCIKEYFPNGIRVGDDNHINELREIVSERFGDLNLPDNNRAIASRIMDKCVLYDRGTYIAKRDSYISKELANKIFNYINGSKHTVFYIHLLFIKFYKDLINEGVGNRYYLHGILKELYQENFYFKRDCLSKDSLFIDPYGKEDSDFKGLCMNIIDFIGQKEYPVQKKEIYNAFPDISEFVMYNVISSKEIISYSGSYLHADYLQFYESEYLRVKEIISNVVANDNIHHVTEVFNIINNRIPEFLTRNFALNQYGCFSLLKHIFNSDFNFYRPYVSKRGIVIASVTQRLHDFVYSNDVIKIADVISFTKENYYQIPSLLQYIKSCDDEFFLISHDEMMKIEKIGITKAFVMTIEDILCEEITKTIPICELTSLHKLPLLAVPWNEWLLFSAINKWGSKLSVSTTSNQFRHTVPIIAPVGELDEDLYKDLTRSNVGGVLGADEVIDSADLDNLDELMENLLDDIWEDDL